MTKFELVSHTNYGFMTGKGKSEKQYLYGVIGEKMVIIRFSPQGDLIGIDENDSVDLSNEKVAFQVISSMLEIESDGINVKQFWIDKYESGIEILHNTFVEFENNPSAFTLNEQRNLAELLSIWKENGQFVFFWDSYEFWVSPFGEITDS